MKSLRGRLIVEMIPSTHIRQSGFIILDRKNVSSKGRVISIGADSVNVKGKPILAPCAVGDIVYFKKYKPMYHNFTNEGQRSGKCTIWWEDIVAISTEEL